MHKRNLNWRPRGGINHRLKLSVLAVLLLVLWVGYSAPGNAAAATSSSSNQTSSVSGAVTQSYNADSSVQDGMIVELKPKTTDTVIPLPSSDIKNMLGVVVPSSNATIVLTPQHTSNQQVLVSTGGTNQVLVSTQNGPIKVGDYITISAVNGIGMKADSGQSQIVGRATTTFNGISNVVGTLNLQNQKGKSTSVSIGRVGVSINITHNPLSQSSQYLIPYFLSDLANNVANKPVSIIRIYLSLALLLMTAFVTANMLYAGIRGSIVAIGRNPLSKKSITRGLMQTVITGMVVFIAGVFAVYLLLKL